MDAEEIASRLIQDHIHSDQKVINLEKFRVALVRALMEAHSEGAKSKLSVAMEASGGFGPP